MLKVILLSAYACEPERGSEPGVGWNWAMELVKLNYEVYVLTRLSYKSKINTYFIKNNQPSNLHFLYFDLIGSKYFAEIIKNPLVENFYYFFWQIGILGLVKQKHREIKFDLIHHITFGVFRHPSFLYVLKVPFVFGPVGGGEDTPENLRVLIPFRYRIFDLLRKGMNLLSSHNPFLIRMHRQAIVIFTKTQQTKELIPVRFQFKTINRLEIGINTARNRLQEKRNKKFSILYAGRLIYVKGFELAIPAFARFIDQFKELAEFTIIGSGKYERRLKQIAKRSRILSQINFVGWISQKELKTYYENADVLLFPSFHDSSGNVVLEALSYGLPVICLNCGGPAAILGDKLKELAINYREPTSDVIVSNITGKLLKLATDHSFYKRMSELSIQRAREFDWKQVVADAYKIIEEKL